MKFHADDEAAPLEVELLTDDGFGESEVSFDRPRVPWSTRRKAIVGAVAAGALVAGAISLGGGNDSPDAAAPDGTSTETTVARPTTTADGPTTSARPRPSTTTTVYTPPAQLATDPGWRIYISTNSGSVREFDPITNEFGESSPNEGVYAVVGGPLGPVFLTANDGAPYALLGDGTGWKWIGDDLVRENVVDGTELERVPAPTDISGYYFGQNVLGTTSEGRPIVMLDDVRAYEVAADGSLSRFAEGAVLSGVNNGQYLENRCDERASCSTIVHAAGGELTISGGAGQQVGFSPDGLHFAVIDYNSGANFTIYDVRSGPVVTESFVQFNGYFGFMSNMGGWSPDGRFFFFMTGTSLKMYDATDNSVTKVSDRMSNGVSVLGVV